MRRRGWENAYGIGTLYSLPYEDSWGKGEKTENIVRTVDKKYTRRPLGSFGYRDQGPDQCIKASSV